LFRYYENAKKSYVNIEKQVVGTLDNRCKPIFDVGMLLLCVTCLRARVSSGKNARQAVFNYMVSNSKICTSGVCLYISNIYDRCLCQGDIISPLYDFLMHVKELLIHGALDAARDITGLDASTTTEVINEYSNSIKRCLIEDFEERWKPFLFDLSIGKSSERESFTLCDDWLLPKSRYIQELFTNNDEPVEDDDSDATCDRATVPTSAKIDKSDDLYRHRICKDGTTAMNAYAQTNRGRVGRNQLKKTGIVDKYFVESERAKAAYRQAYDKSIKSRNSFRAGKEVNNADKKCQTVVKKLEREIANLEYMRRLDPKKSTNASPLHGMILGEVSELHPTGTPGGGNTTKWDYPVDPRVTIRVGSLANAAEIIQTIQHLQLGLNKVIQWYDAGVIGDKPKSMDRTETFVVDKSTGKTTTVNLSSSTETFLKYTYVATDSISNTPNTSLRQSARSTKQGVKNGTEYKLNGISVREQDGSSTESEENIQPRSTRYIDKEYSSEDSDSDSDEEDDEEDENYDARSNADENNDSNVQHIMTGETDSDNESVVVISNKPKTSRINAGINKRNKPNETNQRYNTRSKAPQTNRLDEAEEETDSDDNENAITDHPKYNKPQNRGKGKTTRRRNANRKKDTPGVASYPKTTADSHVKANRTKIESRQKTKKYDRVTYPTYSANQTHQRSGPHNVKITSKKNANIPARLKINHGLKGYNIENSLGVSSQRVAEEEEEENRKNGNRTGLSGLTNSGESDDEEEKPVVSSGKIIRVERSSST